MFLDSRGVTVAIPEQVAGVLTPDAQFRAGDTVYNVEVECSTVAKAAEQVVRNVWKAREAGKSAPIALPDASSLQRVLPVLDGAFPGLQLWPDGVDWSGGARMGYSIRIGFLGPRFGRSLNRRISPSRNRFKIGRGTHWSRDRTGGDTTPWSPRSVRLSRAFLRNDGPKSRAR